MDSEDLGASASTKEPPVNDEEFVQAASAVREDAGDFGAWDALEEFAAVSQSPDVVAELYREVLAGELPGDIASDLGQRAVQFHEEWYREDSPLLVEVLQRVLELDPTAGEWAFQRLTVVYTVAERWEDLLGLYDREIARAVDAFRKATLLEEAAQTAKDFAGAPDRAIDYMLALLPLRRSDKQLVSSLERLLEKQERWSDLVEVWRDQLDLQRPDEARRTRLKIAEVFFEQLARPGDAVAELRDLLADPEVEAEGPLAMLERVAADESVPAEARREALSLLRERYDAEDRTTAVIATLGTALSLADTDEKIALHRDAAARLRARGELGQVLEHLGQVLALAPDDEDTLATLREVAQEAGEPRRLVEILVQSADADERIAARASLRLEAAERLIELGDTEAAITQLQLVANDSTVADEPALAAARLLVEELGRAERREEQLDALERVAALERAPGRRRELLGRAARLASDLHQPDRAIALWERRLAEDPRDPEALAESIALLEREERWRDLVAALRRRTDVVPAPWQRRADLIRVAQVQAESLGLPADAIATWNEVASTYGEDAQVVDALADLYERTERFDEMASVLRRASEREGAHLADIRARLGAVYGMRLGRAREGLGSLRRALDADPDHEGARAGLAELCQSEDPQVRAEAVEALARSYAQCDAWEPQLALLDERLAAAPDDRRRAALLREAARIQEERSGAPLPALASWLRALALEPDDVETEAAALRLAETVDAPEGWQRLADGLAAAAERAAPGRAAALRRREARIRRDRLDDDGAALDAALAALNAQPLREEHAALVVELAASTGRWADAEPVLVEASSAPHAPPSHLGALATVQRSAGSEGLGSTLERIATAQPQDLDALRESAELTSGDHAVAVLERLYDRAAGLWRSGAEAAGATPPPEACRWAVERLVAHYDEAEHLEAAVALLSDVARLPMDRQEAAGWRREAAKRALALGDRPTAIALFQEVLRVHRDDVESLAALGELLAAEARHAELLALRHQELSLTEDPERRIELRMEIARLVTRVEEQGGRMEALRANLEERPGHPESLAVLERLLTERRGFADLAELLASQASRLDGEQAVELWRRVAALAEGPLGDLDRAIEAYRKVAEYAPSDVPALDALARIHRGRGEYAAASRWLERRLAVASEEEHADVALELAHALVSAGRAERACEVLEMALEAAPGRNDLRELLAEQYRKAGEHEALARTLTDAAAHVGDQQRVLELVREAASLYRDTLGRPADAIPVLRKGIELAPEDRSIKLQLAEGLRESGELDEARALLEQVIADFGRRRSAERAEVHYQLGIVARAQGDFAAALEQLDKATKMAKADPSKLEMFGRMAREAGELDRAEKAYRTLLMTVRRQGAAERLSVGSGEVLYELHAIARARGHEEQAQELLESAFEAAAQNDAEALRFRDALLERDEPDLALRGLERRAEAAEQRSSKAAMQAAMAALLTSLGRHDEAFAAATEALGNDPGSPRVQATAVEAARKAGAIDRLVARLEELVDEHRRGEDAQIQASLLVCLGEVTESDLGDADAATSLFGRAEALLERPVVAWLALARVGAKRGDRALQRRVLEELVDAPELDKAQRADALHQLASVLLRDPGALDEAVAVARRAFDADPRHADLIDGLDAATARNPDHDEAMRLYQEVARDAGLEPLWLRYLERRAQRSDATVAQVREAVDKARSLELDERVEPLLERAVAVAEASEEGVGQARWAMSGLAQARAAAGDLEAAVAWMRRAVDTAEDEEERRALELQLAGFAAEAGDLRTAAETYERLLGDELTDRDIWLPLLEVLARAGDEDALSDWVGRLIDALLDPTLRNEARLVKARYLMGLEGREFDAVELLKSILDEDPNHGEAAERLAQLYEKSGYDEDLVELLQRQLDVARDNEDLEAIASLSLRLGELLSKVERQDALDIYRRALDWVPKDRAIIEAYLRLLGPDDDPRERAEVRERLLGVETGEAATRLCHELYAEWQALDDAEGMIRALELGYRGNPHDEGVRTALESHYRETGALEKLAEFLALDAQRFAGEDGDAEALVQRLHEAAVIKRAQLNDAAGAVELLREAFLATGSVELLRELVEALQAAGEVEAASQEVSAALESHPHRDAIYAQLLAMRATLARGQGRLEEALGDLEDAYVIAPEAVVGDLVAVLGQRRVAAASAGDRDAERAATLRLVDVLQAAGDATQARDVLADWVETAPDDRESLERLRDIDRAAHHWPGVVATCGKLVRVLEGEAQVEAALVLADAADELGTPQQAKEGLEHVFAAQPEEPRIIERLRALYEAVGAHRELAGLLAHQAQTAPAEEAFELYRRAGAILIDEVGDAAAALPMLQQAVEVNPGDHQTTVLLADAYIGSQMFAEAGALLDEAIGRQTRKRSPELSELQHRMSRLAVAAGDRVLQMQWLQAALESDKNNGQVAAELAHLAVDLGELDVALGALRAVTLSKSEGPMSRAEAFLWQARIAHQKGEARRALLWARKARSEDPELTEAAEFLAQLGEG